MPGPDFPTGGVLAEDAASLLTAYETGRGGFRLRAKWAVEKGKYGAWQIVVSEIPYQVPKARLIEQIAQLLEEKKLPLLGDARDESAEDVRVVLEPRTRGVEPEVLMETMFRATALETRFPLNMNVLDATRTPRVMSLVEVLRAWLDHRHEVLVRRTRHRLAAIERRIEILDGYLLVYLNLDEVIRIIREEEEPKPRLMARFELSEVQADAILNMRLRSLRRLEEMELRTEHRGLNKERREIQALLKDEGRRWDRIVEELEATRQKFGAGKLGARRTEIGAAPPAMEVATEGFVEREPLTVVLSDKGWIRAFKGHLDEDAELRFKQGDKLKLRLHCQTTDRLTLFGTNGRAYTLKPADLPRGRGDGQPVRLVAELTNEDDVVALFVPNDGGKIPGGVLGGARLCRAGGGTVGGEAHRQADPEPAPRRGGADLRAGRWRSPRGGRLQSPSAGVPAGPGPGDGTRRRRDPAALQGRRAGGCEGVPLADGLTWRLGEKTRTETNSARLARRTCPGRPPAAERFSARAEILRPSVYLSRSSRERSRSPCDAGEGGAACITLGAPRLDLPRRAGEVYMVSVSRDRPYTNAATTITETITPMTAPLVPPELLDPVVAYFNPRRVILFGSRARGDARPDSDIDLLVVVDDDTPPEKLTLQAGLRSRRPTTVGRRVPVREATFQRKSRIAGTLSRAATLEGIVVYGMPSVPSGLGDPTPSESGRRSLLAAGR